MKTGNYFIGASGGRYFYSDIAARVCTEVPHTRGKHIFVQLDALGLRQEFNDGLTPCGLPYTFVEAQEAVCQPL
mgnify:CR=1 FL=1